MALQLEVSLPSGVAGSYWKVIRTYIDHYLLESTVHIALFRDQQARQDGKQPMQVRQFKLNGNLFPYTMEAMNSSNVVEIGYDKLKTLRNVDLDPNWPDPNTKNNFVWEGAEDI